jgi:hypothetical protein
VALARKAADKLKITISFRSVGIKKINELVVNSNKLKYNLAVWLQVVSGGVRPVGPQLDQDNVNYMLTGI